MAGGATQLISGMLFSHPLYDYSKKYGGKKVISVLIAGDYNSNESDAFIIFKSIFNCGQMTENYLLHITLASSDPTASEKSFKEFMPGLEPLKNLYRAEIDFADVEAVNAADYGYIAVAFNDNKKTDKIYSIFAKQITGNNNTLLCAFGYKKYSYDKKINGYKLTSNGDNNQNSDLNINDLNLYAYNCGFAYEQNEDERKKASERQSVSDFYKHEYGSLSSLAFVVHIPYKIKICADYKGWKSAGMGLLLDIIIEKKGEYEDLYNKLLDVEHRRWCAYMIADGWNMPDDKQLQYAFDESNNSNQKIRIINGKPVKLHPCLCAGTDKGCVLEDHFELWNEIKSNRITTLEGVKKLLVKQYHGLELTDLEMISLALYGILNERVESLCKSTNDLSDLFNGLVNYKAEIDDVSVLEAINNFPKAAIRLRAEIPNSVSLFEKTMKTAKKIEDCDSLKKELDSIDKRLIIVKERNKRKNYFTIDAAMIDMIPFMMWYGKEYTKVIVVSNGLASDDVIAPTMMCPEKVIFICSFKSDSYESSIKHYFKDNRHLKIDTEFINTKESIGVVLANQIEKDNKNETVVCLSKGLNAKTVIEVSRNVRYDIPVIQYDNYRISGLVNADKRFFGLLPKSFSVDEYTGLLKGELKEESKYKEYCEIPEKEQFEILVELYKNYSKNKANHIWRNVSTRVHDQPKEDKASQKDILFFEKNENVSDKKQQFFAEMKEKGFIALRENGKYGFFKDEKIRKIFDGSGKMLELLFYSKAKETGLFDDVQQGQSFKWDCQGESHVENEIDVIMINGLTPIFVSCKDRAFSLGDAKEWLYEIHGVSSHFYAVPLLVLIDEIDTIPKYLNNKDNINYYNSFKERAKEMGVSLIGRDTIFDDEKLFNACKAIKDGKVVIGNNSYQKQQ